MKLTTRGNYAIASMLDLALNSGLSPIPLKAVASRLDLSENYLRQLFMELNHREFISSYRGVGGGYMLNVDPKDISLLDIIQAVEGTIFVVPCLDEECKNICNRKDSCSAKTIWELLNRSVKEGLKQLTLDVLVEEYKSKE